MRSRAPRALAIEEGKRSSSLLTEDKAAQRFLATHRKRLRYCHDHKAWFVWNGNTWRKNSTSFAFHLARELARKISSKAGEPEKVSAGRASFAANIEAFARADPGFAVGADCWDRDHYLLGTPAGTIDLRTGALRRAEARDHITKCTAVVPTEAASCPRWLQFLDEATGGDVGLIRFLKLWCGYSLTGDTRQQALVFLYGDGGNGKSVFMNVVSGILGDYAATAAMDTFVASQTERHLAELAMLRGARMVTASETEEGRFWAESRIKQLTGGDPITARFMRQNFFTYMPAFKLTIVGNHKPKLKHVDAALCRRLHMLPFSHRPQTPDRMLEQKLRDEWPSILRWMIEGCLDWQQTGLTRPKSVSDTTDAYFDDQDLLSDWISQCCLLDGSKKTPSAQLFSSWQAYAIENFEDPGSIGSFSQALEKRGFCLLKNVPTGIGAQRRRGIAGIALLDGASLTTSRDEADEADEAP